ncbi:MAG: hypothetical protein Q8R06_11700 [Polaromonas sp.]|uniref:hypothetical protein n=1 Tax=Polaromonas sp. TaxID=1869339 RepID=UPI0027351610|nr:hypothetical protein [Polaromonas sp.]MDP3797795.1 hypothetical protein [Polaromonas sp.]
MVVFKWLCFFVAGVDPFAAIASLIGTFFGLGGWGWILFLWFGFTGMFSLGAANSQLDNASSFSALMAKLALCASLIASHTAAAFAAATLFVE